MKYVKRLLIGLLISVFIINSAAPLTADASAKKYGIIVGSKNNDYKLVNDLTAVSPAGNLMVKINSLCRELGLTYNYDKTSKRLTVKNPVSGKYLVFTRDSDKYTYYTGKSAKGAAKTAAYKCYYDGKSDSNVIHMSTLKYILNYNYYGDLSDTYYADMRYKAIIAYSYNSYSSDDIPVTGEEINFINSKTFTTKAQLLDAIRMNLIARKTKAILHTNIGVMDEFGTLSSVSDIIDSMKDKLTPADSDYLMLLINQIRQVWNYAAYQYPDGRIVKGNKDEYADLTLTVDYETTLAQERAVDSKIADIIKSLKLTDATDYEKVREIHDYIINLAAYDNSKQKSSAYNLLFDKTAVCEGYALTAYRLFQEAGLENRIITGKGNGQLHAWNIVKVDGKWYNIDLTWDDPITYNGNQVLRYDYFLKNEQDFKDHVRDLRFTTKEFMNSYPIAEESYTEE